MTDVGEPIIEVQAEAIAAVQDLMQVLVKGLRATQLYLPNNPVYQKAIENIRNAFTPVWEYCVDLELRVTETDLVWEKEVVLEQPKRSESIAWVLFKDGVRSMTLSPGVEEEEVVRFMQVIVKARNLAEDAEDDLLTLLWEQDFQFVKYDYADLAQDDVPQLEKPETEAPPEEQVRQAVQQETAEEEERPEGIVTMDDFDSTLYFLDDKEIKYLTDEIEREYQQDLRGNVLAMVLDLLELQTYTAVRAELISILENFIPYLLAVGDFRSVAYILKELRVVLERAREVLPEHRETLQDFPDRLSKPDALGQLLQSLDEAHVHPTEEELGELFRELRPEALETVLAWLPKLTNDRVRQLLDASAQRLCQAYPDQVVKALKSDDEAVLLETIRLAGQLKLPPVVPGLGALLQRASSDVRKAAVEALAEIGTPGALKQLEGAIEDEERDVRVNVVRHMAKAGHRGAFGKIEAVINGKSMKGADLTERTAFFEAYGVLAGAAGMATLVPMLVSKGFMKKKIDPQIRACAAMALGKIGTPDARDLLNSTQKDKDPLVRNAVNRALREMSG